MRKIAKLATLAAASSMALSMPAPAAAGDNPWLGEMITVGFNFCPRGWAEAAGQILPINSNQALFSLLGTTYGGDGRTSFALPDLRSRSVVGMHQGPGLSTIGWGQRGGAETHTLTIAEMPNHNHTAVVNVSRINATLRNPIDAYFARAAGDAFEKNTAPTTHKMHEGTITVANNGGNQAFNQRNPYLGMLNCIALQGTFPSRS